MDKAPTKREMTPLEAYIVQRMPYTLGHLLLAFILTIGLTTYFITPNYETAGGPGYMGSSLTSKTELTGGQYLSSCQSAFFCSNPQYFHLTKYGELTLNEGIGPNVNGKVLWSSGTSTYPTQSPGYTAMVTNNNALVILKDGANKFKQTMAKLPELSPWPYET
uniref:Bulb-type lectin domain-containing protein n=1 Tax=Fibrocapsa japonica TaxID=94617 RepID=A0A7S2XWP4_9STRA|mmetsp:Transcript_19903/g.28798  ORF Transcript_19903/g.28798 Transcript_19903/m.28798 type:complete len:163 (+) Transcript_19903:90-578(+)